MSPPLVSVLIPAFNAAAYLEDCLASVWLQVGEFELDVIVIDDGSTDATAAIVGRHAAARLLQQTQHGPAAARNAGITVARGDFIAFLDADDLWPAGSLKARMDVLLNHRDAAMVFGDCRQFDSGGEWTQTLFEAGRLGRTAWGPTGTVPDAYIHLIGDNFITTGSVVVRTTALSEVGHFDAGLWLVEDLDMWLRVARRFPVAWCGEVCLRRRRHASNTSRDREAMSVAYIGVLEKQLLISGEADRRIARRIWRLIACEYLFLIRLAVRSDRYGSALRHARHAMRRLARKVPRRFDVSGAGNPGRGQDM